MKEVLCAKIEGYTQIFKEFKSSISLLLSSCFRQTVETHSGFLNN